MGWMSDETGLEKNAANFVPLTPLSHLRRAATVFADREALVYGKLRLTYRNYHERVTRLAGALAARGIRPGDVVATLLPNTLPHVEASFAIPACGAVLNTINIRLDVDTVAYIFGHGEAKIVLVDTQFLPLAEKAVAQMNGAGPDIIEVADAPAGHPATGRYPEYEEVIASGDPDFSWIMPQDEWESLALNYTSGTTGRPKGVVYHHRGAYLMTMGTPISWNMGLYPRYLTIVPLFHCNNWNHSWMMPALGGTIICCRDITAAAIYDAIADEGVTHFGGAPIVLNMIVNAPEDTRRSFDHVVEVFTAGAPPAAATLAAIEPLGFNITQVYGLTETYGHVTECLWNGPKWDPLPQSERAAIKARTGVLFPQMEDITVMDDAMVQVPMDGEATGEIMIRGNSVMKGYLKNPDATAEAFAGGYFHSGDIAHQTPDGYIQITDRAKDIIISGGENVSSVEVEGVLMHHPAVMLCAVVAKPDETWGEVPCAFVELKDGADISAEELIRFAREHLAGFKTPKQVEFCELPKTSTGKIQKFQLRRMVKEQQGQA
ncbi:Long-chain-fatty-acid--CoA ligase [Aliiroseovarius sp. xm-m-379]|uniref:long-chain-fatty-acid--CoA ligase n=1 Tax=unclassified Aliiroseovarius TaxID=2623558 RepID=UPI0015686E95|nr:MULTISPECIES: long-chain-fatty-acid--CoA ligase [unclassified Aliiroseovarius]NRP11353.1 Long-chain-fatty-acid--CoA ligase [Aliiroseovarius sp. xm-d-517]NRP23848.1 Long-chain-fatty-acid--CoA ligase [Aliiroseovarius sp. xm-m-379]NRP28905.1 Long-chain-fatty-acid--CoA ligase [Aliiroseovarius sp. xm-m-314]NRP32647.1 Long-chain-fatty-acid--CoA ligase [Aliiroseovarius sp. xm-a-104]NRP42600.1 Long-chain-fatty-acid--CoA ligase [Aliiroseovarius sp. xm-m-339-2]